MSDHTLRWVLTNFIHLSPLKIDADIQWRYFGISPYMSQKVFVQHILSLFFFKVWKKNNWGLLSVKNVYGHSICLKNWFHINFHSFFHKIILKFKISTYSLIKLEQISLNFWYMWMKVMLSACTVSIKRILWLFWF